jgi:hypothetical protein
MVLSVKEFSAKIKQKYPQYQGVDDATLAKKIVEKYPEYQGSVDLGGNPVFDFMNAVGQAGASAVGTVAKGAGNVAAAVGEAGSYLDPIANAGRLSKTFTGNEGVFSGYKSPVEMAGKTIQGGVNAVADAAERGSVALSGGKQNEAAQWTGGALGNLANIVGGAALGGAAGKTLAARLTAGKALLPAGASVSQKALAAAPAFFGESLGATQGVVAAQEGRMASPAELALGAGIDLATMGVGRLFQRGAKEGLAKIPRYTDTIKTKLGEKGLKRGGELLYENVDSLSGFGSRPDMAAALKPLKKKTFDVVTKNIDEAVKKGAGGKTIDDLMDGVKDAIISDKGAARAGMSLDEVPKAIKEIDQMKQFYKELYGDGVLDLRQIQQLKKNLRYKAGAGMDALMTAKNQFKEGTRQNAKEFIENEVGRVLGEPAKKALKQSNLDYEVLRRLTQSLDRKMPYSGYLTDVISGSAGAAGSLAQFNVGEALKGAATAIGLKRLATSPTPKIFFAKLVKSGSEKQVNKLISALAKGQFLRDTK